MPTPRCCLPCNGPAERVLLQRQCWPVPVRGVCAGHGSDAPANTTEPLIRLPAPQAADAAQTARLALLRERSFIAACARSSVAAALSLLATRSPPLALAGHDLVTDALAQLWWTRPVQVQAEFANHPGSLRTLEGRVRYRAGAALLTGSQGERWPVERAIFERSYMPVGGDDRSCNAGSFRKRLHSVWARQLLQPFSTRAGAMGDRLAGRAWDWLLQYAPGQHGVVTEPLFDALYERRATSPGNPAAGS